MKELIKSKWDDIMNLMKIEYDVSEVIVNTWIRTLEIYEVKNNTIYFYVEERKGKYGVEYLRKRGYDIFLLSSVREVLNDSAVEIVIDEKSTFIKADNMSLSDGSSNFSSGESDYVKSIRLSNLNPNYTFENFVVGDSNQHAFSTCLMIADLPCQTNINPLFIYGGSGLGKTHLIQSIAHYIIQHDESKKVLYVSSETFTNEIIKAIHEHSTKATEEFREKYRNIDVLIIDDIQEIIGRDSTQKEFFNTFNVLFDAGKQIILSSDRPPRELKTLDERLLSRFEWGVPLDIHAPDYETRMAILRNKVKLNHYRNIPEEVLVYIAENIVSNVRELEGALKKINLFATLSNTPMNVERAQETLKDFISKDKEVAITPDFILSVVSEHMGISVDDINSKKRSADIATARQLVMFLCRDLTDRSLQAIGEVVGKDHSTVSSGIKKIEQKMKEEPEFKEKVDVIMKKIDPKK